MSDSGTLLTVRETARRLGVHENTVRNWVKQGLLRSARVSGSTVHRFDPAEVERLAKSRGSDVASVQVARQLLGPELADATHLQQWASRHEAQPLFPQLIRRLLVASPGVQDLAVRAGEGIAAPGWDGQAWAAQASGWVPDGHSCWELGVSAKPGAKAQSDYAKRTADPEGVDPRATTFVFATPRRWRGARAWEQARRHEGLWRDVRAIDADDLEGWLQSVPAVHYWLSERLGLWPRDARTLASWWEKFAQRTKPALPPELLLAGRDAAVRQLREFIAAPSAALGLKAGWRDEALAFAAASLGATDPGMTPGEPPVIVISTPAAWDRLTSSNSSMVLVPLFEDPAIASATSRGHHVILPLGPADIARGGTLELQLPDRTAAREALEKAGLPFERADRLAALARRSMASLIRELATDPRMTQPRWGQRPHSDVLAPLLLVGAWTRTDADHEIVADITGRPWDDVERELLSWRQADDAPLIRSGGNWHLTAPKEAFAVLHRALAAADLRRWRDTVERVLGETDPVLELPTEEQALAGTRGIGQRYSATMRAGLADGLALLGTFGGDVELDDGSTLADHAAVVVRTVLDAANKDTTGLLWRSLSPLLPRLAEAAPEPFLAATETAAEGDSPLLATMFRDTNDRPWFGPFSPHTGLLWALETLAWSQDHFLAATALLARLAEIDPGGKLSNRPPASLRAILLPWRPHTAAPLGRRLDALRQIRRRYPAVGWGLLLRLLPTNHDVSSPPARPHFREWQPESEHVLVSEWFANVDALIDQVLEDVSTEPTRWPAVIGHLAALPDPLRERIVGALDALQLDGLSDETMLALWTTLTDEIGRHRSFPEAKWSMSADWLRRMESIAERLEPRGQVGRHARLFDWRPELPGVSRGNRMAYEEELARLQAAALREALDAGGLDAVVELAEQAPLPARVGVALAELGADRQVEDLLTWLGRTDARGQVVAAWVLRRALAEGESWIVNTWRALGTAPPEAQVAYLLAIPPTEATWTFVDALDAEQQDSYWRGVNPWSIPGPKADSAIRRMLEHGQSWSALTVLAATVEGEPEGLEAIDSVLAEEVLDACLASRSLDGANPNSLGHEVCVVLDFLDRVDAPADTIARLEWAYFPALEYQRHPRALYQELAEHPEFYVDLVSMVYRGQNEPRSELDETAAARARHAWTVLNAWRTPPGMLDDGTIDSDLLATWVKQARLLFSERDRADIGDEQIGQLLSGSPPGSDGAWPAEPIRELVDTIGSKDLDAGLYLGVVNGRGITSRSPYEGGGQERALAAKYRAWSDAVAGEWPRTARVLRSLADGYERDARREDAEAAIEASR